MQNDRTDKTDNKHSKKHKYGKHKIKKNFKNYVIDKENKDQTNVCMRCEFKKKLLIFIVIQNDLRDNLKNTYKTLYFLRFIRIFE